MDPSENLSRILVAIAVILGAILLGLLLTRGEHVSLSGSVIVSLLGVALCALIVSRGLPPTDSSGFRQMLTYILIWIAIGGGIALLYKVLH